MRYGLVGTGFWAQEVHAAALDAAPHTALTGVWGRDPERTAALADRFGTRAYDDPAALFADVDAVSFSVPPDVQAALAVPAAAAGCHLMLEKPTGLTVDQADAVLDASREHGVATMVLFTSRFLPEVADWLDRTRDTGGWTGGQATWLGSIFHPGNPFGASPWRKERGALWDIGPHALSITLPLLGSVDEVSAMRGPGDTVHLALRHTDGASSTVLVSHTVPEAAARSEVTVYGEAGWERMPEAAWRPVAAHQAATLALARCAETGEGHPCDATFARDVVEILARAEALLT